MNGVVGLGEGIGEVNDRVRVVEGIGMGVLVLVAVAVSSLLLGFETGVCGIGLGPEANCAK